MLWSKSKRVEDRQMAENVTADTDVPMHAEGNLKYKRQSSVNKRARHILSVLSDAKNMETQLECLTDLCQILVMGDANSLSGFPVEVAVPLLVQSMKSENFDLSVVACRALCYMMDVLPTSVNLVVGATHVFVEKLQVIDCLDIAEQALVALEKVSFVHYRAVLEMGGVSASLLYFDFLPAASQRNSISIVANCTKAVNEDNFPIFADAIPVLTQRLQHQDVKLVDKSIYCFSRLINNLSTKPKLLEEICSHGLLTNLQQLLVVSPPVLVESTFVLVFQMLSRLCSLCPGIAVQLMKICIVETLHYLITEDETPLVGKTMMTRSPSEFSEFISLLSELLPPLPTDGIFEINSEVSKSHTIVWLWQGDNEDWHEYDASSHQLIEESVNSKQTNVVLLINGRTYTVDFVSMKQFNVQSGHVRNVKKVEKRVKVSAYDPSTDERFIFWKENPSFYDDFIKRLFFLVYEAHVTMEHPLLRLKSLYCILRNIYYARRSVLTDVLKSIPISSHLAMLLTDSNLRIIVGCIQLADVLMRKLPEIFQVYFRREGVMHKMKIATSNCLKLSEQKPVESSKEGTTVPTTPSGFERFSSVLRRSSSRLKRLLSRRDPDVDSKEEPSTEEPQHPKLKQPRSSRRMTKYTQWIAMQSDRLLSVWEFSESLDSHEAFVPLRKLEEITDKLTSKDIQVVQKSLEGLRDLYSNIETCPTPFEMMHCELAQKLLCLLAEKCRVSDPLWVANVQCFLQVFCAVEAIDSQCESFKHLIHQLHMCLNQVEHFPVVMPSLFGSKDIGSMAFLSNRPLNCKLERHPSDFTCKKLEADVIRIHPLASIKTVENYLLSRVCHHKSKTLSDSKNKSGIDRKMTDAMALEKSSPSENQALELLVGETVLPKHSTVVEALLQCSASSSYESASALTHSFWARSHTIYYRKAVSGLVSQASNESPRLDVKGIASESQECTAGKELIHRQQKQLAWLCKEINQSFPQNDELQYLILKLLRLFYLLYRHWQLVISNPSSPQQQRIVMSKSDFTNHYLASKVTRQLQDGLTIATGHFSWWLTVLPRICPFLFPFDLRVKLFYVTCFGHERAIIKMQEHQADTGAVEGHEKVVPQLEKSRHCILRQNILEQVERIFEELGSSRKMLEIEYEGEVGTGLGPTMEFYTLVSREFQRTDLCLWKGDKYDAYDSSAGILRQYFLAKHGLFPAPLHVNSNEKEIKERCRYFNLMGKFLARTLLDSRLVDMQLSRPFCKWILGMNDAFTLEDLQDVDPVFASSYTYLHELAHSQESEETSHLVESLNLNFTLPGYENFELKPGGCSLCVSHQNLLEYLELVFDWIMVKGVEMQFTAFKDGFNSVFPVHYVSTFHPDEIPSLLCGDQLHLWNIRELQEHVKLDHGYSYDSRVVQAFFQIMTSFNRDEQQKFLQFVTGSPRLPIGGFSSLTPPLTVVRKSVEQGTNPDGYLPSVMTCMNYLKLPEYSSMEVMRERILIALNQGQMSFHLS